jgi:hypothetical protein
VVSAGIAAPDNVIDTWLPFGAFFLSVLNGVITFMLISILFATPLGSFRTFPCNGAICWSGPSLPWYWQLSDWSLSREWNSVRANDGETQTPLEFRPYGAEG